MADKEVHVLPNGEVVEYFDETHTYYVNGEELPSVTSLLATVYGDIYSSVNPELLKRSAEYGSKVHDKLHEIIEVRKVDGNVPTSSEFQEVENYFTFVEPIYHIQPLETEKVVVLYDKNGKPAAAGRFDLLCNVGDELTLADFKTTSSIHRPQVTAQLNLYAMAAYQSGYIADPNVKLGVIHLSGKTSKFIPIPKLDNNFYLQFIF